MTELVQLTEHPAPWPHRDLDVAAMRARGHEPVPFRQFILKVHSRCNLSCTYCYVYEMAEQGWPALPRRMDTAIAALVASLGRIAMVWLNGWGLLLAVMVLGGIALPLYLRRRQALGSRWTIGPLLVLLGGLILRAVIIFSSDRL